MAAIRYLEPFLVGREASSHRANLEEMNARLYGNESAKSAIDMALYDIAGKAADKPVHALLGERRRDRMPVLWMLADR